MGDNDTASATTRRPVSTGRDNHVTLRPFNVSLTAPNFWDPSAGPLQIAYDIHDPTRRIRHGRIRYVVIKNGEEEVTVHTLQLQARQLKHGRCYELPASQQWDGTITSGLPDQNGQRVTADLTPIFVHLEVWNTDQDKPGNRIPRGRRGRTDRQGECLEFDVKEVDIQAINEAKWDRNWVVPMPPQEEDRDKDQVTLTIETKNVREGTPVRVEIARINEIDNLDSDHYYIDSEGDVEGQPGLQKLVVRKNRVVNADNGEKPYVIFNQYEEHWKYPGNNFYAFSVGFGSDGSLMIASERDYVNQEKKCLHMRFTVLIHHPAGDLSTSRNAARQLHHFFRKETRYWRSYLLLTGPPSIREWARSYGEKFAVLFLGHAAAYCTYPGSGLEPADTNYDGHPVYWKGRRGKKTSHFKKVPRDGFPPDQNLCPTAISKARTGGCGQKDWFGHQLHLGRSPNQPALGSMRNKKYWYGNRPGRTKRDGLELIVQDNDKVSGIYTIKRLAPRFLFFGDSCRTIMTTNFGEHYTAASTKYFHGWVFTVDDSVAASACNELFRTWIKGTPRDPASSEYDLDRFLQIYRHQYSRTRARRKDHPRIMDETGVLNSSLKAAPTNSSEALE